MREAQVNRDPPPLFLLEPVGVDSRERAHQGRLAVIDMPRRAYDDRLHAHKCSRLLALLLPGRGRTLWEVGIEG